MGTPQFFRYFIGCRPDARVRAELAKAGHRAGQDLRSDLAHFTFCVIAEVRQRDYSIAERLERAFAGDALYSTPILFGRVVGGPYGAMVRTIGRQDELQDLYRGIVHRFLPWGFTPKHRKSGFRPHSTLGHAPCRFDRFDIALEWIPDELLLIESEVGLARHNVKGRWPLLRPRQVRFDFEFPEQLEGLPIAGASRDQ